MAGRTRLRTERAMSLDTGMRSPRRQREWMGRFAEVIAALSLILRGYRILARRHVTPYGEIDLIAVRGHRLAFIEVKQRRTLDSAHHALVDAQTRRLHAAGEAWVKRYRRYRGYTHGFDAVLIAPWCWPRLVPNGLQPAIRHTR